MKNLKKIIILLLIIVMSLNITITSYADNNYTYDIGDLKTIDEKFEFLKAIIDLVDERYQYDINNADSIFTLYNGLANYITSKQNKFQSLDLEDIRAHVDIIKDFVIYLNDKKNMNIDIDEFTNYIYFSFFSQLDKYTQYMPKEDFDNFSTSMGGQFTGVGIILEKQDDFIKITNTLPNSPAEKAGILANDTIVKVDEKNICKMSISDVKKLITGEENTNVTLTVKRKSQTLNIIIKREIITISSIREKLLDGNIGYIQIVEFKNNTTEQFVNSITNLIEKKADKFIIDVRNNPGGSLQTVLDILDLFIEDKPLMYKKSYYYGDECFESTKGKFDYPVCVLVNENSASASEIFAGAMQDTKRAKIVGKTTYGKGIVQTLYPLKNDAAIKITTAEYFTPNKNSVHKIGITPDYIIENKADVDIEEYPKLNKKRKAVLNDIGLDVLGAEMILKTLGYNVTEPDGIFDKLTFEQLKKFQTDNNLFSYGKLDFTTQDLLTKKFNIFIENNKIDYQMKKAIELLKNNQSFTDTISNNDSSNNQTTNNN